ncbi:MAG TPA: hypothetical protein VL285_25695 [Bryobacteraceae bacterium]|jgi:hypothetical protein|nr:hypothetical protein [Bryobacteraceae bacterium]
MRTDLYTKIILTVIAGLLASVAFRPVLAPAQCAREAVSISSQGRRR